MILFFKRFRVINSFCQYSFGYKWVIGLACMSCLMDVKAQSPNLSGKAQNIGYQNKPVSLPRNSSLRSLDTSDATGSVVSPVILPLPEKRTVVKNNESDRVAPAEKILTGNLANGIDAVLGIGAMAISGLEMQSVAGPGSSLLPVVVGQVADQSKQSKK